jgi:hypothetical protein
LHEVQGTIFPLTMPLAIPVRTSFSFSFRGFFSLKIEMFSIICDISLIPERIMVTPGTDCTNLNAHSTGLIPGRSSSSLLSPSSGIFASMPPRRGSITHMGMFLSFSISAFLRASWNS